MPHPTPHTHLNMAWDAGALHPRRRVHGVPKEGELGQLGADKSRHAWPGVHPDTDLDCAAIVGHEDL